jgi:ssDNA-binding Zn-finger/Zn-ribbon topoisomerase 1
MPEFKVGDTYEPSKLFLETGKTTPPSFLTESELITLMDKFGIGTDATIAEHIKTIQDRGYARQEGSCFKPTLMGTTLIKAYETIGIEIYRPYLRSGMERDMKDVCLGLKNNVDVYREMKSEMRHIYSNVYERRHLMTEAIRKFLEENSDYERQLGLVQQEMRRNNNNNNNNQGRNNENRDDNEGGGGNGQDDDNDDGDDDGGDGGGKNKRGKKGGRGGGRGGRGGGKGGGRGGKAEGGVKREKKQKPNQDNGYVSVDEEKEEVKSFIKQTGANVNKGKKDTSFENTNNYKNNKPAYNNNNTNNNTKSNYTNNNRNGYSNGGDQISIPRGNQNNYEYAKQSTRKSGNIASCPRCQKDLRIIKNKDGKLFMGCTGFPSCKQTFDLNKASSYQLTDQNCGVCELKGHSYPIYELSQDNGDSDLMCLGMCLVDANNGMKRKNDNYEQNNNYNGKKKNYKKKYNSEYEDN